MQEPETPPRCYHLIAFAFLACALPGQVKFGAPVPPPPGHVVESFGKLPISFEPNQGQVDPRADFIARGSGYSLYLTPDETALSMFSKSKDSTTPSVTATLRTRLAGARHSRHGTGLDQLPGKANYYIGNDSSRWRTGIPMFAKVKYESVYPGVDLVYYGNQRRLEYDFVVAPGASPSAIRMEFNQRARLDADGDLVFDTAAGSVRQHRPTVYQEVDGQRRMVAASYRILGKNRVGFQIAKYDRTKPLVIDPIIIWARYVGGTSYDQGRGIAVDSAGQVYFGGGTGLAGFPQVPSPNPPTPAKSNTYGFAAKLSADGTQILYSNVFGGEGDDFVYGLALDAQGNAYLTGSTNSSGFPLRLPLPRSKYAPGTFDAFVVKFTTNGALSYSTKLGGHGSDYGIGIAVVASGVSVYVSGITQPYGDPNSGALLNDFPTTALAFQKTFAGGPSDAFVARLAISTVGLVLSYSTYLGGSDLDEGAGIALDSDGNAWVTGGTASLDFPLKNPFQRTFGGTVDAFVAKLNSTGSDLLFSTYLGGNDDDRGHGVAVDGSGNAYVAGHTASFDFPTLNAFQSILGGGLSYDAFVAKFSSSGTLIYSTLLGGYLDDYAYNIAVDSTGSAYVVGGAQSPDFPVVGAAPPTVVSPINAFTVFVSRLDPSGSFLLGSVLLNGDNTQLGEAVAIDSASNAYLTGYTDTAYFPATVGGGYAGADDAFVAKITFRQNTSNPSSFNSSAISSGNTIWFNGNLTVTGIPPGGAVIRFDDSVINFAANGQSYSVNVPRSEIHFVPSGLGTTSYDAASQTWTTAVPIAAAGSVFLTGVAFPVPVDFPGGINPVTWYGRFSANSPSVRISWKWNAAVFTSFASDPTAIGVKTTNDGYDQNYPNNDQAGTPESWKQFLTKGAKDGKPTAWNWSSSKSVTSEIFQ
jgi:hypothetical protein